MRPQKHTKSGSARVAAAAAATRRVCVRPTRPMGYSVKLSAQPLTVFHYPAYERVTFSLATRRTTQPATTTTTRTTNVTTATTTTTTTNLTVITSSNRTNEKPLAALRLFIVPNFASGLLFLLERERDNHTHIQAHTNAPQTHTHKHRENSNK